MNRIMKFIKDNIFYFYCLLVAFCFLSLTSKNSFLYPFNDWVDANAFFTVGKSMFNGVTLYKDIFEQKGPLLYVIYGIGYLLSNTTFHGVFILEVLFFSIFLFYIYKLISLFINKRFSFIIIPILTFLLTTCNAFVQGGSCEEFCFPFFAISLYYFSIHFLKKKLNSKELIINGFIAGCILLTKFTFLGFWLGFMLFIFLDFIINKKYRESIFSCIYFLIGMFIPIILFLIYFICTDSYKDFIECYFKINITLYSNAEEYSIFKHLVLVLYSGFNCLLIESKKIFVGLVLIPIIFYFIKINKYYKISIIGIFLITFFGIFFGLRYYDYYVLPLFLFIIFFIIGVFIILGKNVKMNFTNKSLLIYVLFFFIFLLGSYFNANYREELFTKKEDTVQYKYAEYMNKYDNPTLLNMRTLDCGFYTSSGIIPNTRFFEVQNIAYERFPDNINEMKNYVNNKKVMFIIYPVNSSNPFSEKDSFIYDNYELVMSEQEQKEKNANTFLLFKLKDK